jgi:hypothetical protein
MGAALGGIVVVGALLIVIGVVVHFAGTHWIEALMPPVVTGTIGRSRLRRHRPRGPRRAGDLARDAADRAMARNGRTPPRARPDEADGTDGPPTRRRFIR